MSDRDGSKRKPNGVNAENRLALALRENLHRRKAQARARASTAETANESSNSTSLGFELPENELDMKG
jgi:hypothetical protein